MFKQSFIKLACISPVVEVGLPLVNAKEIVNSLTKSRATINLFPELATTGYSCGDLFFNEQLMKENYEAIQYIVKNNPSKGIVVFGAPLELTGSLFNCAIVVKEHEILGVIPKKHLPNYAEFSEKRWFQQGLDTTETSIIINGKKWKLNMLLTSKRGYGIILYVEGKSQQVEAITSHLTTITFVRSY